jgi:hypothetical protein
LPALHYNFVPGKDDLDGRFAAAGTLDTEEF